jgi:hypothetical protein
LKYECEIIYAALHKENLRRKVAVFFVEPGEKWGRTQDN